MVTREEIYAFVNELPAAGLDYPFEGDFNSAVLRHTDSKKWFGLIIDVPEKYYEGGGTAINLKCPADLSPFLIGQYKGIIPAYHMNKKHWISVMLNSDVPAEELFKLIELSYDITGKRNGV